MYSEVNDISYEIIMLRTFNSSSLILYKRRHHSSSCANVVCMLDFT